MWLIIQVMTKITRCWFYFHYLIHYFRLQPFVDFWIACDHCMWSMSTLKCKVDGCIAYEVQACFLILQQGRNFDFHHNLTSVRVVHCRQRQCRTIMASICGGNWNGSSTKTNYHDLCHIHVCWRVCSLTATYDWFPVIWSKSWRVPHVGQEMLTLSGIPDFTPFGEFMISPIRYTCIYIIYCWICQF